MKSLRVQIYDQLNSGLCLLYGKTQEVISQSTLSNTLSEKSHQLERFI